MPPDYSWHALAPVGARDAFVESELTTHLRYRESSNPDCRGERLQGKVSGARIGEHRVALHTSGRGSDYLVEPAVSTQHAPAKDNEVGVCDTKAVVREAVSSPVRTGVGVEICVGGTRVADVL